MRRPLPRALLAACCALLSAGAAVAGGLTASEEAGRKIYREGASVSGAPIQAKVGPQSTAVAGTALPCANCHGADGLGRPEGSVVPPNITWRELTKSYGHRHENGREHPAYTEAKLKESLTFGTDPAGNRLDSSMPRYLMSNQDLADLIAYLKKIETDFDPGIAPDRVRIGVLVPTQGRLAEVGQLVGGLIRGFVEDLNARGGIYGRSIELVQEGFDDDPARALASARKLVREQNVFALVSPFTPGAEHEIAALAEQAGIPVVGPVTLTPDTALAVNRYTFYVLPGLREQARALAKFGAADLGLVRPPAAIVYPRDAESAAAAEAAEQQFRASGLEQVHRMSYDAGTAPDGKLVAQMQQQGVQVVLFLGSDADLAAMGPHVRDAIWSPYLLAPGPRVGRAASQLPVTFGDRVFLAFPTSVGDITPKAAGALSELDRKHKLGTRFVPLQVSTYAALQVMEEGLKRAGRDLSRARLVDNLENLFSFESGVSPKISFGPNRRIGAMGAHVVQVDLGAKGFRPVGKYVILE